LYLLTYISLQETSNALVTLVATERESFSGTA